MKEYIKNLISGLGNFFQKMIQSRKAWVWIIATVLLLFKIIDGTIWIAAAGFFVAGSIVDDYLAGKNEIEAKKVE